MSCIYCQYIQGQQDNSINLQIVYTVNADGPHYNNNMIFVHFIINRTILIFTFIVPCIGNRTHRRTGGLQQKITHYTRGWLYRKNELLMMSFPKARNM